MSLTEILPVRFTMASMILLPVNKLKVKWNNFLEQVISNRNRDKPTVYGVKLSDQLRLGSFKYNKLHDCLSSRSVYTLKWSKAPVAYSNNIQLEISPAFKKVLKDLVDACLVQGALSLYSPQTKNIYRNLIVNCANYSRNSPLTFTSILQPLFESHNWIEGNTVESFLQECPAFQLIWKTLQQWMNGEEVWLYYTTDENILDAILSAKDPVDEISNIKFMLFSCSSQTNLRPGQIVDGNFIYNSTVVYNLNWKDLKVEEFVVSFLLTKDHNLNSNTHLFVMDVRCNKILYSTSLRSQSVQRRRLTNPNPRRFPQTSNPPIPAYSVRCQESEDDYKLVINTRQIKLKSSRGIHFY